MAFYAGDLSYADGYQPRWDSFGRLIEPSAARVPWQVIEGNHEEGELARLSCTWQPAPCHDMEVVAGKHDFVACAVAHPY